MSRILNEANSRSDDWVQAAQGLSDNLDFSFFIPSVEDISYGLFWRYLDIGRKRMGKALRELEAAESEPSPPIGPNQAVDIAQQAFRAADDVLLLFQAFFLIFLTQKTETAEVREIFRSWRNQILMTMSVSRDFLRDYAVPKATAEKTLVEEILHGSVDDRLYAVQDVHRQARIQAAAASIVYRNELGREPATLQDVVKYIGSKAKIEVEVENSEFATTIKILNRNKTLKLERSFLLHMTDDWIRRPSLLATSHALEAINLLRSEASAEFRVDARSAWRMVCNHYKNGRFFSWIDQAGGYGPIDNIAAFSILKSLKQIRCGQPVKFANPNLNIFCPPSSSRADQALDAPDEESPFVLQDMRSVAIDTAALLLNERIVARGAENRKATVIDLHHALSVLWHLFELERGENVLKATGPYLIDAGVTNPADMVLSFLSDCRSSGANRLESTFCLAPGSEEKCLTAVYFVDRIAEHCELWEDADASGVLHSSPEGWKEACMDFVLDCWSASEGGFAFQPGHSAELAHTYLAVRFLKECKYQFRDDVAVRSGSRERPLTELLFEFLQRCRKQGGYALLPEWWPTAYGTRLALQLCKELGVPYPSPYESYEFIQRMKVRSESDGDAEGAGYVGFGVSVNWRDNELPFRELKLA